MSPSAIRGALAALAVISSLAPASGYTAERARHERPDRRHERPERGRELHNLEQQIHSARSVTRRVQRDPRISPEIKRQAAELDGILDARERTLAKLDTAYRDFLAQHKAELDELEGLRRRALEIDDRLSQARTALLKSSEGDVAELKRGSKRARELVDALRDAYATERRSRHGR